MERKKYSPDTSMLGDLVRNYGMPRHFFLDLITKYEILTPERTSMYAGKAAYTFGSEEIARIETVLNLRQKGYQMREIAEHVKNQERYQQIGIHYKEHFITYAQEPTQEHYAQLIQTIAQIPTLEENERQVYIQMNTGLGFWECAQALRLPSDEAVRSLLDTANQKIGKAMPLLFASLSP